MSSSQQQPNTNSRPRTKRTSTGNSAPMPTSQEISTPAQEPAEATTSVSSAPSAREVNKVHTIVSKEHYQKLIDEAGNKLILIEFFARWCGPCHAIGTKLEELAERYENRVVIVKVDVDDFEDIAIENDVTMMPNFVFLKNKKKLEQFAGNNSEKIVQLMEKFCGEPALPDEPTTEPLPAETKNQSRTSTAT